jgi:hypothetical protein
VQTYYSDRRNPGLSVLYSGMRVEKSSILECDCGAIVGQRRLENLSTVDILPALQQLCHRHTYVFISFERCYYLVSDSPFKW